VVKAMDLGFGDSHHLVVKAGKLLLAKRM